MTQGKTNRLEFRTPEGIVFSLALAGPITRFLAWGVDFLITTIVSLLLMYFASTAEMLGPVFTLIGDWMAGVIMIAVFVFNVGYNMAFEWLWRGQTIGKWLLRLRVVDEHGLRLQFSQIALRNLMRIIDMLPGFYCVGVMACYLSRRAQRLGDYAANTVVIRTPKTEEPDLDKVLAGKYNSFREYPHIEARLRQRISPDVARIALQAMMRRDDLELKSRIDVFAEIAAYLRGLAVFPEEATFALTDEQYVRNAVDSVYRRQRVANEAGPRYNEVEARR